MSGQDRTAATRPVESEFWLCGECLHIAEAGEWDCDDGNYDTAVCPGCGFVHRDNEMSWVDADPSEIDLMRRRAAELLLRGDE